MVVSQMLIRKPVAEVFEAIVNPEITTRFWFSRSSGRLEPGKKVRWDWEMFGVEDTLTVNEYEENARLLIEWESDPTLVEWQFESRDADSTLVTVLNWGFLGTCEEVLPHTVASKGGYTIVLAGLKAWLEFGIELNLIRDQFPDGCPD
ncbi:SRPBCC family protein [Thalassoglobus neptunius]|nr:SRPBCC family protein [Thalassoglobus neptunius]